MQLSRRNSFPKTTPCRPKCGLYEGEKQNGQRQCVTRSPCLKWKNLVRWRSKVRQDTFELSVTETMGQLKGCLGNGRNQGPHKLKRQARWVNVQVNVWPNKERHHHHHHHHHRHHRHQAIDAAAIILLALSGQPLRLPNPNTHQADSHYTPHQADSHYTPHQADLQFPPHQADSHYTPLPLRRLTALPGTDSGSDDRSPGSLRGRPPQSRDGGRDGGGGGSGGPRGASSALISGGGSSGRGGGGGAQPAQPQSKHAKVPPAAAAATTSDAERIAREFNLFKVRACGRGANVIGRTQLVVSGGLALGQQQGRGSWVPCAACARTRAAHRGATGGGEHAASASPPVFTPRPPRLYPLPLAMLTCSMRHTAGLHRGAAAGGEQEAAACHPGDQSGDGIRGARQPRTHRGARAHSGTARVHVSVGESTGYRRRWWGWGQGSVGLHMCGAHRTGGGLQTCESGGEGRVLSSTTV
eukprot:353586-Chlamydomonas_euryale.AAC.1